MDLDFSVTSCAEPALCQCSEVKSVLEQGDEPEAELYRDIPIRAKQNCINIVIIHAYRYRYQNMHMYIKVRIPRLFLKDLVESQVCRDVSYSLNSFEGLI